jgi:hypothetical protein
LFAAGFSTRPGLCDCPVIQKPPRVAKVARCGIRQKIIISCGK